MGGWKVMADEKAVEEILLHLQTLKAEIQAIKQAKSEGDVPQAQVRLKVPISPEAFTVEAIKEQFNTSANTFGERFDYIEKQLLRLNDELGQIQKSIHKHGVGGHLRWIGKKIVEGKAPHAEKFFQDFESLATGFDNALESKISKRIADIEEKITEIAETQDKLVEALQVLSHIKEAEKT